jgi:hypothetical protein
MKLFCTMLALLMSLFSLPFACAEASDLPLLESGKHEHRVHLNHLYAFDAVPLGGRIPLLLVPGRAQEGQRNPWWKKFETRWKTQADLQSRYKLYIFMYDSKQKLEIPTGEFVQEFEHFTKMLGKASPKVVLLSYSQGGLIVRNAFMQAPELLRFVDTIFGMSVPYQGTPLFDESWVSQNLNHYSPIRRGMDKVVYELSIKNKRHLVKDMLFVNFDTSKPKYSYPIKPFGLIRRNPVLLDPNPPKWVESTNPNLREFKSKLVVYGSYLKSQYSEHGQEGRLIDDLTSFGTIARLNNLVLGAVVPTYVPSVHRTFEFTGRDMAQLPVANVPNYNKPKKYPRGHGHPFRFNDGFIPASSLFYLPVRNKPYTEYIGVFPQLWDICGGRFLEDLDHVDLGHYRFPEFPLKKRDVFHGNEPARKPIDWLFEDLRRLHTAEGFSC